MSEGIRGEKDAQFVIFGSAPAGAGGHWEKHAGEAFSTLSSMCLYLSTHDDAAL